MIFLISKWTFFELCSTAKKENVQCVSLLLIIVTQIVYPNQKNILHIVKLKCYKTNFQDFEAFPQPPPSSYGPGRHRSKGGGGSLARVPPALGQTKKPGKTDKTANSHVFAQKY